MKTFLLLLLLSLSGILLSQNYNVVIKIAGVEDLAAAKEITDPIRYKYEKFPLFNDSTDQFEFETTFNFSEEEIELLISENGYGLLVYKCIPVQTELETEEEEVNE